MTIRNGQSRENGNIGHTRQTKQNKHKTTQHRKLKKMCNMDPPKTGMNPGTHAV